MLKGIPFPSPGERAFGPFSGPSPPKNYSLASRSWFGLCVAGALVLGPTPGYAQDAPLPVRNDIARAGSEFLVLRHQELMPGAHEQFYEISRTGVWPFFEEIGTRVVGQWQVVYPEGNGPEDHDDAWRLARYRSYNHWEATRTGQTMAGNGPDFEAMRQAISARRELLLDSDGPIFLEGHMAPGGPHYHPGLEERYEPLAEDAELPAGSPMPVRHGRASPGREILTLRYFRIAKGSFEEFHRLSRDGVWPFFEKMGARIVGQWRVLYPTPDSTAGRQTDRTESADYDEAYMLVRYAGYEHWQATRPAVMHRLGGNGPDYDLCKDSLERRADLTYETSVQFLQGHMFHSPPVYLPALDETYRRID